jgi:hypothetical protein
MKLYVISGQYGCLQIGHYDDTPRYGVLVYGDKAHLFTYSSAKRAIKRTQKFVEEKGLKWDAVYNIVRIELQPNSPC